MGAGHADVARYHKTIFSETLISHHSAPVYPHPYHCHRSPDLTSRADSALCTTCHTVRLGYKSWFFTSDIRAFAYYRGNMLHSIRARDWCARCISGLHANGLISEEFACLQLDRTAGCPCGHTILIRVRVVLGRITSEKKTAGTRIIDDGVGGKGNIPARTRRQCMCRIRNAHGSFRREAGNVASAMAKLASWQHTS
jgi:DNA-directed RNA polymerase subunit RPC12/RpoP